jgi:hypothetical protein
MLRLYVRLVGKFYEGELLPRNKIDRIMLMHHNRPGSFTPGANSDNFRLYGVEQLNPQKRHRRNQYTHWPAFGF